MMTNYSLRSLTLSESRGKRNLKWLRENSDVKIDYRDDGICIHNICAMKVSARKNGEIKEIPMSICSDVIKNGGVIIIDGRTFIVEFSR